MWGLSSYFFGSSANSEDVIKSDMPSISQDILKKHKKDQKQEDKYRLNLNFQCEGLAQKQDSNSEAEYYLQVGPVQKEEGSKVEKQTKKSKQTERVRGNNPIFAKQIEVDFSFSKYVKLKVDVYHCVVG